MNVVILLWAFVTVVASTDEHDAPVPSNNVNVSIYYEALCPHSQKFFNEQFSPNMQFMVDNVVNVQLIPYGKMQHNWDLSTNSWRTECRHSETECDGHRVQVCALDDIPNALLRYQFIACLMKRGQKYKPYPGKECADQLNKSAHPVNYAAILQCATSPDVEDKLEGMKRLTEELQPPLGSVPVIVFNQVYQQHDQNLALSNFKAVVCNYLAENHQDVKACTSASSAEGHAATFTLVLTAFLMSTV